MSGLGLVTPFATVKNMDVFHGAYRDVFTAFAKGVTNPRPDIGKGYVTFEDDDCNTPARDARAPRGPRARLRAHPRRPASRSAFGPGPTRVGRPGSADRLPAGDAPRARQPQS